MFSPWQKLTAETYGDGDNQHVQDLDTCQLVGDTLFTFLMIELDAKEGCDDWPEALRRVVAARDQLEELYDVIRQHAPYLTPRGKQDYERNLAEAAEGDTCTACERDSLDCSRDPCAAVIEDRAA